MENIFQISNVLIMPFWLLMVLLPHWQWTKRIIASPWIAAPVALLYTLLVLPALGALLPLLASPSLDPIAALLGTAAGATIAWAHFLALDLFAGRWVYLEGQRLGISAWILSPLLLLVLMLGPFGLLVFLLVRWFRQRSPTSTPSRAPR